jgi:hypothetical protein
MLNRLAAAVAMTAILACSGMGLCWRLVQPNAHDCCSGASHAAISVPATPCTSAATAVDAVKLVPPQVAPALFVSTMPRPFALAFPPRAGASPLLVKPPLVLRI